MKTYNLLMPVVVILSLIGQAVPSAASDPAPMPNSAATTRGNLITRQWTAYPPIPPKDGDYSTLREPPVAQAYVPTASATSSAICPDLAASPNRLFLPLIMRASGLLASASASQPQIPPDPGTVAPPLDRTVATDIAAATAFLYSGSNPIQTGVAPGTIGARCVAVLRGKIQTRDGQPLAGVTLTILNHPEYGQTLSRADGAFDIAVNGGKPMTIAYTKDGYLPLQRTVATVLRDYVLAPTVVMIVPDSQVTTITSTSTADFQVAQGSVISDTDGQRQATLLFPQGVSAVLTLTNGTTQTLGTLNVRATEYTVGDQGAAAMPGDLPANSGYTYAVELSVDEVNSAGAAGVRFDKPLINYTQNFIHAPVGSAVPTGYYDRAQGKWIGSKNGRVIKLVSKAGGMADVDITGDGVADTGAALAALGITNAERQRLANLYDVGQELWRVEITHFSPWDHNWPFGPPPGAKAPQLKEFVWKDPNDPCREKGSIIGCETQTLGEDIPLVGTPFNLVYQSDRTPGWKANQSLDIPVTGAILPPLLKGVRLQIEVNGRQFERRWEDPASPISSTTPYPPIVPNLSYHFEWDGLDAYGRLVQGRPNAIIRVMYIYDFYYYKANDAFQSSFAQFAGNTQLFDGRASCRNIATRFFCGIPIEQTVNRSLGPWDAAAIDGLGAWTLDIHHSYDPNEQALHKGDGTIVRSETIGPVLSTLIGGGSKHFPAAEGGSARDAYLEFIVDEAVGPDGSLYVIDDTWAAIAIRKVDPNGKITTIAGNGLTGDPTGDGGPALNATLGKVPGGIAIGPDGSLYLTVVGANYPAGYIRKIDPNGIITTIAGINDRTAGNNGDGGPAKLAKVSAPIDIVVGPDGSIYFGERNTTINNWKSRVRRIDLNGIINTIAGGGTDATRNEDLGSGEPATQHDIWLPYGLAFGPDGSLYITDPTERIVTRVTPDGILKRFAGTRGSGHSGDGGLATQANIADPTNVAVSRDGTVYFRSNLSGNSRVRKVTPDGTITSYAGTDFYCNIVSPDGEAARRSCIFSGSRGLDFFPDGGLIVSDGNHYMRKFALPLGGFSADSFVMPSQDGIELYEFSSAGRHLRTLDALTGAPRYAFSYDSANWLASVTDGDGNVTHIERAADGTPLAIVAPGGQRTVLALNGSGYLGSIANPAGETTTLAYATGGLLTTLTDPRGGVYRFSYDADGRLVRDEDPSGGVKNLVRVETTTGMTVTVTTGLGKATVYATGVISPGDRYRTVQMPSGATTTLLTRSDGVQLQTDPDGTRTTVALGPDPRWGMRAPIASSVIISMPNGLRHETTTVRTVTLSDKKNLMSLQTLADQVKTNGNMQTMTYDAALRTLTFVSAEHRTGVTTLDAKGRVARIKLDTSASTLSDIVLTYDTRGRPAQVVQGAQSWTYAYDALNRLTSRTDASGTVIQYGYDAADRVTQITLPGNRLYRYAYDANGNRTTLTMPSAAVNTFGYTPINLDASFTPPGSANGYRRSFSVDGALSQMQLPGGNALTYAYNSGYHPASMTSAEAATTFGWDSQDRLSAITRAPAGGGATAGLSLAYSGFLIVGSVLSGSTQANLSYTFGNDLAITGMQLVSGGDTVSTTLTRDKDGLVTGYGPFAVTRGGPAGAVSQIGDGTLSSTRALDSLARVTDRTHTVNGQAAYRAQLTYNNAGRITQRIETIAGSAHTFVYQYGSDSQLTQVSRDGTIVERYAYDANGNRISRQIGANAAAAAAYDTQDRITSQGGTIYQINGDGFLIQRGADTFQYGLRGELLQAITGGNTITYAYDGIGRRVSRTSAAGTRQYIYGDPGNVYLVTAVRDEVGVLTALYYDENGLLFALQRSGVRYYVGADQVGTPRVVSAASGTVVKQIEYDSFGVPVSDSNPAFDMPIGFAGGLPDPATGLVRFGFRDYDPMSGRWTARDPVFFAGSPMNLYAYVGSNPIGLRDPSGLACVGGGGGAVLYGGGSLCLDDQGYISGCLEGGLGAGGGVDVDFTGNAAETGLSLVGELTGKLGPGSLTGGFELDLECMNLKPSAKAGLGPLSVGVDRSGFSGPGVSAGEMGELHPRNFIKKAGAKAEGKLVLKGCLKF